MNDQRFMLDASAVLAFLFDEKGAARVATAIPFASISTVNLSEVVAKLYDGDVREADIVASLADLDLEVVPFDQAMAVRAGSLRAATRVLGLALGDRACLATAEAVGLAVLTADRAWAQLDLGLSIEILR